MKNKHTLQNCRGCLKNSKYRELLARLPVNLKNAKEKNDRNTSLSPDIGHILQDRTNKIMASAGKAAHTEFKFEFDVTFKQPQTYIQEHKKKIYNEKRQIAKSIKTNIEQKWKSNAVDR